MNHKKQSFLLAVPLLALGAAVGLSWLWKRRHAEKTAHAA